MKIYLLNEDLSDGQHSPLVQPNLVFMCESLKVDDITEVFRLFLSHFLEQMTCNSGNTKHYQRSLWKVVGVIFMGGVTRIHSFNVSRTLINERCRKWFD